MQSREAHPTGSIMRTNTEILFMHRNLSGLVGSTARFVTQINKWDAAAQQGEPFAFMSQAEVKKLFQWDRVQKLHDIYVQNPLPFAGEELRLIGNWSGAVFAPDGGLHLSFNQKARDTRWSLRADYNPTYRGQCLSLDMSFRLREGIPRPFYRGDMIINDDGGYTVTGVDSSGASKRRIWLNVNKQRQGEMQVNTVAPSV